MTNPFPIKVWEIGETRLFSGNLFKCAEVVEVFHRGPISDRYIEGIFMEFGTRVKFGYNDRLTVEYDFAYRWTPTI